MLKGREIWNKKDKLALSGGHFHKMTGDKLPGKQTLILFFGINDELIACLQFFDVCCPHSTLPRGKSSCTSTT